MVNSSINGTELIENPLETIMSPFTDLIGVSFWLIPIGIIAAALYVRTHNITVVAAWLLSAGMLMASANIFSDYVAVLDFYLLLVVIGVVSIILSIVSVSYTHLRAHET